MPYCLCCQELCAVLCVDGEPHDPTAARLPATQQGFASAPLSVCSCCASILPTLGSTCTHASQVCLMGSQQQAPHSRAGVPARCCAGSLQLMLCSACRALPTRCMPGAQPSILPTKLSFPGEAMEVLKAYYLQLRAASAADPGSLPVTARQLESLVRVEGAERGSSLQAICAAGQLPVCLMDALLCSPCCTSGGRFAWLATCCTVFAWPACCRCGSVRRERGWSFGRR